MFLVSIYLSYMATPEGISSYLFLEPRFLVLATGFFGFGVGQMVSTVYAGSCVDPAGPIAGFATFVAATCWFDLPVFFCTRPGSKIRQLVKWLGLQILAIVPVFFTISGDVPNTVKVACGVFCASATVSNALEVVFTVWNPLQKLSMCSFFADDDDEYQDVVPAAVPEDKTPGQQQQQQQQPLGTVSRIGGVIQPLDYSMDHHQRQSLSLMAKKHVA
jgi:hypothetical protein